MRMAKKSFCGLGRFVKCRRATSGVEFAFIAPILILMLIGSMEAIDMFRAQRNAVASVNALADLTSRAKEMNNNERDIVFASARAVLGRYGDQDEVGMIITSIQSDPDGKLKVRWSQATHADAYESGDVFIPPDNVSLVVRNGDSIILAQLEFKYKPFVAQVLKAPFRFVRHAERSPRFVPRIPYPPQDP